MDGVDDPCHPVIRKILELDPDRGYWIDSKTPVLGKGARFDRRHVEMVLKNRKVFLDLHPATVLTILHASGDIRRPSALIATIVERNDFDPDPELLTKLQHTLQIVRAAVGGHANAGSKAETTHATNDIARIEEDLRGQSPEKLRELAKRMAAEGFLEPSQQWLAQVSTTVDALIGILAEPYRKWVQSNAAG